VIKYGKAYLPKALRLSLRFKEKPTVKEKGLSRVEYEMV
jgi:hypothetical protein